jgi:hypothetical protein
VGERRAAQKGQHAILERIETRREKCATHHCPGERKHFFVARKDRRRADRLCREAEIVHHGPHVRRDLAGRSALVRKNGRYRRVGEDKELGLRVHPFTEVSTREQQDSWDIRNREEGEGARERTLASYAASINKMNRLA